MSWTGRRKASYTLVFLILVLGVVGFIAFKIFYTPPTCMDGILNQGERDIDCGGPCERLCAADFLAPRIYWERIVPITGSLYSVMAYGENLNADAFVPDTPYRVRLYDAEGLLIASRDGIVDISPASRFTIFAPNMDTGTRIPVRALVEVAEVLPWRKTTETNYDVSLVEYRVESASSTPRLVTRVRNQGLRSFGPMTASVIVYDTHDVAFAFSQTIIDGMTAGSEQTLVYTWPKAFEANVGRVELIVGRDWPSL